MKFLILIAVFAFISVTTHAQPKTVDVVSHSKDTGKAAKSKESYKDIIQKAQNLTLQQDRLQASKVLVRVITSESYNKKAQEELKKTLNDISTIFYTEKTQKLFEYAKSLLRESQQESAEKFAEAIKAEPDNILILLWSARLSLFLGKCEEANQTALKAIEINPFYSLSQLVELQAKACIQDSEQLNRAASEYKHLENIYPLYFHMVLAQKFFNQKQYPQANYHIERAKQVDKNFPEIYFWESQILEKQESSTTDAASKYIRGCKTVSKADYLKYELEPRLCQELKAFEIEYKNLMEQESKKDI